MFNSCKTSKDQGNIGVAMAIAYYVKCGYTVSIPLNDSQNYDLVVDMESVLFKIQVKTTKNITSSGSYEVELRNKGGTSGSVYGRVCNSDIDYVFIVTNAGTMYNIPASALKNNTTSVSLGSRMDEYKVLM